jgi:hypothetical protein
MSRSIVGLVKQNRVAAGAWIGSLAQHKEGREADAEKWRCRVGLGKQSRVAGSEQRSQRGIVELEKE